MTPRARANLTRVLIAAAVIGAVALYLTQRGGGGKAERMVMGPGAMGSGAAAGSGSGGGAPAKGGTDRVVPVQVATAENTDLPVWLEGLGSVMAFQQVTVRPQVDGRLDKVLFVEGQAVKAGDVLAQIDPRPFRVKLLQAQGALARDRSQLDAMRKQYERFKSLKEQNLIAQQQVDEIAGQFGALEGAVRIDQAAVEEANLQLDWAAVKSPLSGVTGIRIVDAGNIVSAASTTGLVVITQLDPAAIIFTVPQDRLPAVAAAQQKGEVKIEVYNRDGSEKLADGTLAVLDNQVNASTSTLRLKAIAPNVNRTLWPNAFVKVKMLVETKAGALVIPAVAIQRGPQGSYVYVAAPDRTAQMKPVKVALLTSERAVIESGISAGEQVVIEGASQLRPGGKLEIIKPDKKGSSDARGSAAGPTASNQPATK